MEIKIRIRGRSLTMDSGDIKALLLRRGETQGDLAKQLNCTQGSLSRLLRDRQNLPGIQQALASTIERMATEYDRSMKPRKIKATGKALAGRRSRFQTTRV